VSASQGDRRARLAYVRVYTDANIWRVEAASPGAPATSPPAVAIASTRRDAIAHFAPDGRHVTFTSTRSGENEIWRAEASGADAVQLTFMGANPGWPRWSPSSDQIAFHSNPEGTPRSSSCLPRAANPALSRRIRQRIRFPPSRVTGDGSISARAVRESRRSGRCRLPAGRRSRSRQPALA